MFIKKVFEELLSNVSNYFYRPTEVCDNYSKTNVSNNSLYTHLNISYIFYHHQGLFNLIANIPIKPIIIGISKSRLGKGKLPINNNSLLNFTFSHTNSEIIPSTYVYHSFCLEDWVLWLLFILVSETQSASMVVQERL